MIRLIDFYRGELPLLVSFPHSGTSLPDEVIAEMTEHGRAMPDTDWFLPRLYDSPIFNRCSRISANFSRYLIDVNRPPDGTNMYPGQPTTELCPTQTFAGEPIYSGQTPDAEEISQRFKTCWENYHKQIRTTLEKIKDEFGHAILLDAHSIASRVPRLFDGQLPDFNVGTAGGTSCRPELSNQLVELLNNQRAYTSVINGRFIGGYITRSFGDPKNNVNAIQIELSQATYMNEETGAWDDKKAAEVQVVFRRILELLANHTPKP